MDRYELSTLYLEKSGQKNQWGETPRCSHCGGCEGVRVSLRHKVSRSVRYFCLSQACRDQCTYTVWLLLKEMRDDLASRQSKVYKADRYGIRRYEQNPVVNAEVVPSWDDNRGE